MIRNLLTTNEKYCEIKENIFKVNVFLYLNFFNFMYAS